MHPRRTKQVVSCNRNHTRPNVSSISTFCLSDSCLTRGPNAAMVLKSRSFTTWSLSIIPPQMYILCLQARVAISSLPELGPFQSSRKGRSTYQYTCMARDIIILVHTGICQCHSCACQVKSPALCAKWSTPYMPVNASGRHTKFAPRWAAFSIKSPALLSVSTRFNDGLHWMAATLIMTISSALVNQDKSQQDAGKVCVHHACKFMCIQCTIFFAVCQAEWRQF